MAGTPAEGEGQVSAPCDSGPVVPTDSLRILPKCRCRCSRARWGRRVCISHKPAGGVAAAGPRTTLGETAP